MDPALSEPEHQVHRRVLHLGHCPPAIRLDPELTPKTTMGLGRHPDFVTEISLRLSKTVVPPASSPIYQQNIDPGAHQIALWSSWLFLKWQLACPSGTSIAMSYTPLR